MPKGSVICVVGPTAVGKSDVADGVACELGGEVVSIDSMQVYRGMDIGTAKTPFNERRCTLHMVDVADVCEPYSVAQFQEDARLCVDSLMDEGRPAILCGGTGLYLDAVVDEMDFPRGNTVGKIRKQYEAYAEAHGGEALHALLAAKDPASARLIHPNNVRRAIRALEMYEEGKSYALQHEGLHSRVPHYTTRMWALFTERSVLYARINKRVDRMFEDGLVDEVRMLCNKGLKESVTARNAIGYKEVMGALDGSISLDEARELTKRNSRRYAKRQLSWIKRDGRANTIDVEKTGIQGAVKIICDDWRTTQQ